MRRGLRLIPLLSLSLLPVRADVDLVRVWPSYRTAESFVGIGEYFGQPEATGGRIILRSEPEKREGFYWLIRLRSDVALDEAAVEVAVIRPGQTEPEVHQFTVALPADRSVVLLPGLTGADWPDAHDRPLAWRIRVLDSSGRELAAEQSFLWSLPTAHERQD